MNITLTNDQRDLLGIAGMGLAIVQTLLAIYTLTVPYSVTTEDDVKRARKVRGNLGKMFLLLLCSEVVIVIAGLIFWLDGQDWRFIISLLSIAQAAMMVLAGIMIFNRSRHAISVAIVYAIFLTIATTVTTRYRAGSEALDTHVFINVFRAQLLPFTFVGMALTGFCFVIFCIKIVLHLANDGIYD